MGKALRKLDEVPVWGVKPPVHTKVAGSGNACPTALGQIRFKLTVLGATLPPPLKPAFKALIASTMLFVVSPPGMPAVAGPEIPNGTEIMSRRPSYPPKKTSLSLLIFH